MMPLQLHHMVLCLHSQTDTPKQTTALSHTRCACSNKDLDGLHTQCMCGVLNSILYTCRPLLRIDQMEKLLNGICIKHLKVIYRITENVHIYGFKVLGPLPHTMVYFGFFCERCLLNSFLRTGWFAWQLEGDCKKSQLLPFSPSCSKITFSWGR